MPTTEKDIPAALARAKVNDLVDDLSQIETQILNLQITRKRLKDQIELIEELCREAATSTLGKNGTVTTTPAAMIVSMKMLQEEALKVLRGREGLNSTEIGDRLLKRIMIEGRKTPRKLVTNALFYLRESKKIERRDDGRYYPIPEAGEL